MQAITGLYFPTHLCYQLAMKHLFKCAGEKLK
jgi:hypothetical protein